MSLFTVTQWSVFGVTVLASLILAGAEEVALPAAITLPVAVVTLVFRTSSGERFLLNTTVANVCGVVAFIAAAAEFSFGGIEARLLSGAHLLVYLTWIMLLRRSTSFQFWTLLALSVMQVAVSALLTQASLFGLELVGYLVFTVWTLSIFTLYRARQTYEAVAHAELRESTDEDGGNLDTTESESSLEAIAASGETRPSLVDSTVVFRGSSTRGGVQRDKQFGNANFRFATGTLVTSGGSLVMGALLFLFIPRTWIGDWRFFGEMGDAAARPVTGFSSDVRLGGFGEILESVEPVMSVELVDAATGAPLGMQQFATRRGADEPMFRGTMLRQYARGGWKGSSFRFRSEDLPTEVPLGMRSRCIEARIVLEDIGSPVLFTPAAPIAVITDDISLVPRYQREGCLLYRSSRLYRSAAPMKYSCIVEKVSSPPDRPRSPVSQRQMPVYRLRGRIQPYLEVPPGLERVRELANRVVSNQARSNRPLHQAEALEAYLRDSAEFGYSLDMSIYDSGVDPVEDFLFNRKFGHCEYFASALAIMLRCQGTPTRLINGFKGGELDDSTGKFVVQQRHAHSWVEALIGEEWVTFDPTPAARAVSVEEVTHGLSSIQRLTGTIRSVWSSYVLQMDLAKQNSSLFKPISDFVRQLWDAGVGGRNLFSQVLLWIRDFLSSPRHWISWTGGVVTFVLLTLLAFATMAVKRTLVWLVGWQRRSRNRRRGPQQLIEFYERLKRAAAERGIQRSESQTAAEFADTIIRMTLQHAPDTAGDRSEAYSAPQEIARSFYRVRYGHHDLDQHEQDAIWRLLEQWEACLRGQKTSSPALTAKASV